MVTSDATALFTINYNNNNVTDNKDNPLLKSSTNRTLVLLDESVQGIVDPIVSRIWYYWNVSTGWTILAGRSGVTISGDGTTVTINDYDANLTNTDSFKKGFKLETTTKSGFKATAEHETFFRYGSVTASYKDVDTNTNLYPDDKFSNLFSGTQPVTAKAAPTGYTLLTASPQNITLDQSNPDKAVAFYYKKGATAPGTGTIVVQHKDKKNPTVDVLPPDNSKTNVPYGTYTIAAEPAPSGYTFDSSATPSPQIVILNSSNSFVLVTFYYMPVGGGGSGEQPPIAVITGPSERIAGENVNFSGASSKAFDGKTIVELIWEVPGARINSKTGKNISVWYPEEGDYDVFLTVVDSAGLTGECMTSIKITPPIPTAVIDVSGIYKENRKVSVNGENSYSPPHYPINKYNWTLTNEADARYIGSFGSDVSKDMIFRKAQAYRFDLKVTNTYGLSNSTNRSITIVPDVAPTADFSVATQVLRDPKNNNTATITATNLSKSTDGDTIKKTVMFYAYDSNNDGNFDNETWYYSKDGTTWTATGLTYSQFDSFDLYNLSGASNPATFTIKTNQVGKYKFECKAIEDILAADTIPSLLTAADYKTGITLTSKPNSAKIVEVINTAPQVSFEVRKKKPVDIFIFTDYANTKLDNLQAAINVKKAQLNAINIDPNFVIVNTSKAIGMQALKKYRYYRDLHFIFKINSGSATDMWMPSSFPFYKDEGTLWEEKVSYEKPVNEISFGRIYSSYQYINTTTRSGFTEAITRNYKAYDTAGGYEDISFNTYYNQSGPFYEWTSYSVNSVYADPEWKQDTYIGTDNLPVTSIDLDAIKTMSLRAGSDRYAIFISDGKGKDYSASFGSNFTFGSFTNDLKNYINTNNFKVYTVADPRTMNTLIDKEVGIDVKACNANVDGKDYSIALYQTSNGYYYFYHTKTNKPYVVDISTFGEIKSLVSPGFILMANGTTKYFDGNSFKTIPVNNVLKVQTVDYNYVALIKSNSVTIINIYDMSVVKTFSVNNFVTIMLGPYSDLYPSGYFILADSSNVNIVNMSNFNIAKTFNVNGLISINKYDNYESFLIVDSSSVYAIRNSTMNIYRTFSISGGVKDTYPQNGSSTIYEGDMSYNGIYVLNKTGSLYKIKDANYDGIIETLTAMGSPLSGYSIDSILANIPYHDLNFKTTNNKLLTYSLTQNTLTVKDYDILDCSLNRTGYIAPDIDNYSRNEGNSTLILHNDRSVECSYTIITGETYSRKDDEYYPTYGSSPFYTITLPNGVMARKIAATPFGMFIIGSDNNIYKIRYTMQLNGPQTPSVSLYMAGVSDISSLYVNNGWPYGEFSIIITKTDGSLIRKYCSNTVSNRSSTPIYTTTISNVKKYAATDYNYYVLYKDGTCNNNIISSNITMTNPSAGYITLNNLVNSNYDSMTYGAGQYSQALDHLVSRYTADPSYSTNYILLGDTVSYNVQYADTENDPIYKEYWTFNHNQYYFDNPLGIADFNAKTLNYPITYFDKTGLFNIDLKMRDNPKNDDKFDNYRLYNQGIVQVNLYVHRKPIALQRITIAYNGNGTYTVKAFDAGSYDLDHTSRADKGIAAREWRWKESLQTSWTSGQMNKSDCTADKVYMSQLRVKDLEGAWSDWNTIELDNDNPPVALFEIDKKIINISEKLKVKDLSFPRSFSTLTQWHWIVRKLNADGSVPAVDIQNSKYSISNNGTGTMVGYDMNVKTDYSTSGAGRYRVYLRVKDSNGLWSDGGTDAAPDLSNFYSQDFEADIPPTASFTIEKNTIKVDETLKLKDTSVATGTSSLAKWNWIVKKLNTDGSVADASIQDKVFTGSNTGTEAMLGYEVNVKTQYADTGVGTYRIYLRVMNGNGIWSDGGTETGCNLGSCFTRDIVVEESFKMSNFRVVRVKDLHLDNFYYNSATGQYVDRPMNVNAMAIDYLNFGGLVDGLTKGYLFEFEIDTANFNDSTDTIVITPHFYTCDAFYRDAQERDLYWENSHHEILKAGEGGHSNWAEIELTEEERIIKEENNATWRGSYLIPGTAWAVPQGTLASNAKASRINRDIIVNFEIKGYKNGVMKYNYNLKQWPLERNFEKVPYEVGDVIRYSHMKSNLDDNNVILNRP